jgi:hypothetical protein
VTGGTSLWWIDWRLSKKEMARETAGRLGLLFLLGVLFLAMVLSGGVNRFLSERWTVSAVLRNAVPAAEGAGIAGKLAALPPVREAVYKDPETTWREFLAAYPGFESLRAAGGNPMPGYIEVRLRPEGFTRAGIRAVEEALRPLPQVERVMSGGEGLPRLIQAKEWANILLWGGIALFCAATFAVFFMQEKSRTAALSQGYAFLAERGVPPGKIAVSRAAAASLLGCLLGLGAAGAAYIVLVSVLRSVPFLVVAVGRPEDLLATRVLVFAAAFLVSATLLAGGASLLGWRSGYSGPR